MSAKAFYDESTNKVIVRGAKVVPGQMDLLYRNFAGNKTDYNDAGNRNFCIKVAEEDVDMLTAANVNIKRTKEDEPYFKVNVRYDNVPPTVARIKTLPNGQVMKTIIDEDNLKMLDRTFIAEATISISPYFSKKNKRWTCYLSAMMFTPLVDPIQEEIDALDGAECEFPREEESPF